MRLQRAEQERFAAQGFVGPFDLCSAAQMAVWRARLRPLLQRHARPPRGVKPRSDGGQVRVLSDAHLYEPLVWDLARMPAVVERLASLLGPDLLLWRSVFWCKQPGSGTVGWHQDLFRSEGKLAIKTVSCWLALVDTDRAGGCVQLLSGSHKRTETALGIDSPYATSDREVLELPAGVAAEDRVAMELRAGQFFLFDQLTAHGSGPHHGETERVGLALRYVPADTAASFQRPCVLVRGKDRSGRHALLRNRPTALNRWRFEARGLLRRWMPR